jgi:hypothetical protein
MERRKNSKIMKKNILIVFAVAAALSLTAFSYVNWSKSPTCEPEPPACQAEAPKCQTQAPPPELDIVYKVESRFATTITKQDLHKATSVLDVVPVLATDWKMVPFQTLNVAVMRDGREVYAKGTEKTFNAEQRKLLQTTDYSTNFYLQGISKDIHPETGRIETYYYYVTVIPEKEAGYVAGKNALITYLRESCKTHTIFIVEEQLRPAQVGFTITKEGKVSNVKLLSSSGYANIDPVLVDLIANMPGEWTPAENANGEKVDQELVFFFGVDGC